MVAGCHLCPYLVRTFSDLGSVNITQKRRSFPSFYAKAERFADSRGFSGPAVSTDPGHGGEGAPRGGVGSMGNAGSQPSGGRPAGSVAPGQACATR